MSEEDLQEAVTEAAEAPPETQEAPEAPQAPQWSEEDADEARLFGWKAPDEWQGDKPQGYIDNPGDYLDRVKRSRIFKTMEEKLQSQEAASSETARRMEAMNARALERQKEQFEQRTAELRTQRDKAAEEGDFETYKAVSAQEQEHLKNAPQEPVQSQVQQPETPKEILDYQATPEGAWLNDRVLAVAASDAIAKNPSAQLLAPMEQAEYALAQVKMMFPDRFPAAKAKPKSPVDPGGMAPPSAARNSAYDKLPSDAKAQFKRFAGEGLYKDDAKGREEYANDYNRA